MKKGLLLILGLGSFMLGFLSVQFLPLTPKQATPVKQAQVKEPVTLSIPKAQVIDTKVEAKKAQAKKPMKQKAITLDIQVDDRSQRVQAYDDSLDNALIDIMEEGRKLSSAKNHKSNLQKEIHHESTHLKIQ